MRRFLSRLAVVLFFLGLQLSTGVAIAFPRAPMVTAQIAWDLQRASNGRFALGLGSQIRKHNRSSISHDRSPSNPFPIS